MTKIVLMHLGAAQIVDIVHELRLVGYQTGQDFDFAYTPGGYNWQSLETTPAQTEFTFYNQSAATWFALKYSRHAQ